MHPPGDRLHAIAFAERARLANRLRVSLLASVLLGFLLYSTTWLVLRPGLSILLFGQITVSVVVAVRRQTLGNTLDSENWFHREVHFIQRLAIFESLCQAIGFLLLGYEFWQASRSLLIAVLIGVLYPALQYAGITRRTTAATIRQLRDAERTLAASA